MFLSSYAIVACNPVLREGEISALQECTIFDTYFKKLYLHIYIYMFSK